MLTITFKAILPSPLGNTVDHTAVIPDLLRNNHVLKSSQTLTATGLNAAYLLNTYTTGDNPVLSVVNMTSFDTKSFNSSFNGSFG